MACQVWRRFVNESFSRKGGDGQKSSDIDDRGREDLAHTSKILVLMMMEAVGICHISRITTPSLLASFYSLGLTFTLSLSFI